MGKASNIGGVTIRIKPRSFATSDWIDGYILEFRDMKKEAYIAINPKTRDVVMACGIGPEHADAVADAVRNGDVLERITLDEARNLFMEKAPEHIEI